MSAKTTAQTLHYEITIELPNGDWRWRRIEATDFHEVLAMALTLADTHKGGRVHHIQKLATPDARYS
jgi:hypothetical protein